MRCLLRGVCRGLLKAGCADAEQTLGVEGFAFPERRFWNSSLGVLIIRNTPHVLTRLAFYAVKLKQGFYQ